MKTAMLLLVFSVALLFSLTPARSAPHPSAPHHSTPHHSTLNLMHIIDLAAEFNKSLTEDKFVEDVSLLAESCGDKFYCQVLKVLKRHDRHHKTKEGRALVMSLNNFTNSSNANCTEVLKEVKPSQDTKRVSELLESLAQCIRLKIFGKKHT